MGCDLLVSHCTHAAGLLVGIDMLAVCEVWSVADFVLFVKGVVCTMLFCSVLSIQFSVDIASDVVVLVDNTVSDLKVPSWDGFLHHAFLVVLEVSSCVLSPSSFLYNVPMVRLFGKERNT